MKAPGSSEGKGGGAGARTAAWLLRKGGGAGARIAAWLLRVRREGHDHGGGGGDSDGGGGE